MTTTQTIKKELYECAEAKGRKLYTRYNSWTDESKAFDDLAEDVKRVWILTALGKCRPDNKGRPKQLPKDDPKEESVDDVRPEPKRRGRKPKQPLDKEGIPIVV